MFRLADLLSCLARPLSHRTPKSAVHNLPTARRARRLFLESLEPRRVLSTFTVINTDDSGAGSLRQAIIDANDNAGHDTIEFNIPGAGAHTITPLSDLPAIGSLTTMDATTQPGFVVGGPRLIELQGTSTSISTGLRVGSSSLVTIRGFAINGFTSAGIDLHFSTDVHIEGNYIGLDPTGTTAAGSTMQYGVRVTFTLDNMIGGFTPDSRNVISGNQTGIYLDGPMGGVRVVGNYIGTEKTGLVPVYNEVGVEVFGSGNHIGEPGAGNIIHSGPTGGAGVRISSTNNSAQGNYIPNGNSFVLRGGGDNFIGGGTPGAGNFFNDISITSSSHHNRVQGNHTSGVQLITGAHDNFIGTDGDGIADDTEGNVIGSFGVDISFASHRNVVAGNLIGTDATGLIGMVSGGFGVFVRFGSNENRIGTNGDGISDAFERNVISGGFGTGVSLYDGDFNVVAGNFIGTNKNGDAALPNGAGVVTFGVHNRIGTNGDGVNDQAERNVISGNTLAGVGFGGGVMTSVAGNFIGTDATGLLPLGNGVGVQINHWSAGGMIGGSLPGTGNVISGNHQSGIDFVADGGENTIAGSTIYGNYIGVDKTGTGPLGNGLDGIWLGAGVHDYTVGGVLGDTANVIAYNGRNGITVSETLGPNVLAINNSIRGNSIFANAALGIDLAVRSESTLVFGVTPYDPLDSDVGANELQNSPELTAASSAATTRVQGALHSIPNSTFTIDFYASSTVDPSGYGEGERWLGSASITTDADGNAAFDVVVPGASSAGEFITSTATDAVGNTSEFSQAVQSVLGVKTVTIDIKPESLNVDSNGTLTVVIFGAADFDAGQIDVSTVHFAGAAVWQSTLVDANNDGRLDLQVKFRVQDTALEELYAQLLVDDHDADGILDSTRQTAQVEVSGQTLDDALFSGADNINLFLAGRSLRNLLDELFG